MYDIRKIINTIADTESFVELRKDYGKGIITGFMRLAGKPLGVVANNCSFLGGAIDSEAAEKAADFFNLCNNFSLSIISLCDTPGFIVGPESEKQGAMRRVSKLFTAGAKLTVPLICIIIRKGYGLGAMAMAGGSLGQPLYTAAWPTGEFGAMGLEGAVKLGFKKDLEAEKDQKAQKAFYDKLVQQM